MTAGVPGLIQDNPTVFAPHGRAGPFQQTRNDLAGPGRPVIQQQLDVPPQRRIA